MRSYLAAQQGVTVIELMVSMLLLTMALVGLAAAIPMGVFGGTEGGLQSSAVGLAQEPIDQAKRTTYANLPGLASSRAAVSGFGGFEREVLVTSYAPTGCSGTPCSASCPVVSGVATCRTLETRVYYTTQLGGEVQTTLTAIFSK